MAERSNKTRICTSLFIMILLIIFLLPVTSVAAEEEGQQETVVFCIGHTGYSVGGKEIKTDVAPYIKDGRTMVPVAFVAGALGADEIRWIPSERKVVIQKEEREVSLEIGSKDLYVNNDKITMDVAAEIKSIGNGGGRTMLPISFVAKAFEIGYEWDSKTRSVSIYKFNKVIDQAGVFGPESDNLIIRGNATVKADKVTLQNMTILGNLIVDKEVGAGTVYFKNLSVMGDTLVRGGGKNSIHIIGGSYHTVIVQDTGDGVVRVVAADINGLEVVIAEGMSGEGVILEGNFQEVRVEGNHVNVQTQGITTVDNFTVASGITGIIVSFGSGTTVENMILGSVTSVTGDGKIQNIVGGDAMLKPANTPSSPGNHSDDSLLPGAASKFQLTGSETVKAGEAAEFTVEAKDQYGNQVPVDAGLADIITVTDDKGILTPAEVGIPENKSQGGFTWSCTQAGLYTLTAAADGMTSSKHEITVEPAEVSEVLIDREYTDSLTAGEQLEFYASAYDQYGNVITFDADDFSWTGAVDGTFSEDTAGSYEVSAEYNGVGSDVETVAVIAGQEYSVSLAGLPDQWTAGGSIDILNTSGCSIELLDRYGNTVADGQYPVTIRSDKMEAPLFGQGPVQFTDGQSGPAGNTVTIPIQLTASGEHTIAVQAGEAQDTLTVQVDPGPAAQFVVLEGDISVTAGEETALTLEVRDEYGNPTGDHSDLADVISASGGTISPGAVGINSEESQAGFTFASDASGSYQITAAYGSMISADCGITVNPGAPAALTVGALTDKGAGEQFNLEMDSLRDNMDNTLLNGTYHLEIISDREGSIFNGNVAFDAGARTQEIKLNDLGDHLLSVRINGVTVAIDVPVTIIKYGVTGVSINEAEPVNIKMEETVQLSAAVDPANATYPEIIWSSSNPDIAKVNADGVVTGMSKGSAVITATSADSGITDTIAVEVDYLDISGKGTQEEPFVIYTFAGLEKIGTGKYISNKTTLGPVYYQLGADIDASSTKDPGYNGGDGWEPITALRMQLDGKGHKISNLMINRPDEDNVGLFGSAETSSISNLALVNVDITGRNYVGGLSGRLKYSNINNTSVTGVVTGTREVGGLAGLVYGPFGAGYRYINECYTAGQVSASEFFAGGLVGSLSELYEIQNSYSQASVSSGYGDVGGLIGYVSRYGRVTNCYAAGSVSGSWAYASNTGGLIGFLSNDNTKIVNSYYDKETSGKSDTGKGLPRTTSQMKAGTNSSTVDGDAMYTNWSTGLSPGYHSEVWDFGTDTEYPVLKNTK